MCGWVGGWVVGWVGGPLPIYSPYVGRHIQPSCMVIFSLTKFSDRYMYCCGNAFAVLARVAVW